MRYEHKYEEVEVALAWHPGWISSLYIVRYYPDDKSFFYMYLRDRKWGIRVVCSTHKGQKVNFKLYLQPGLSPEQEEDFRRQSIAEAWQIKDGMYPFRPGAEWADYQHWINRICRRMVLANAASWAA